MAAEDPAESFRAEASCPICLGLFQDPVSIPCGHSFCRGCVTRRWEEAPGSGFSCPRCQEPAPDRSLRPNRELAKIIQVAQRLSLRSGRAGPGGERLCQEHGEALKLFCEEDETPICLACREAQAHRAHAVVPIEEAAEEEKERVQAQLRILRDQREKLLELQRAQEGESLDLLERLEQERQRVVSGVRELHRRLEGQERRLLRRLAGLGGLLARRGEERGRQLQLHISCLGRRLRDLEEKSRQPPWELLRGGRTPLSRLEQDGAHPPGEPVPERGEGAVPERGEGAAAAPPQELLALPELMTAFRVSLTLDPDTAHPRLLLSPGLRGARWGRGRQRLPRHPKRFDSSRCVLAREGLGPGRHYWEVGVGGEGGGGHPAWALGVALESVRRKGRLRLSPSAGVWALGSCGGVCRGLGSPGVTLPPLSEPPPGVIGVFVDYEAGRVGFVDPRDRAPLYTHPPAAFGGEKLLALLCLGRGCSLTLRP